MERVLELISLLKRRKSRITRKALESRWGCSSATVYRVVERAREYLGVPISFDSTKGVYFCEEDKVIEATGLWFNPDEIASLLGLTHWLEMLGAGVLSEKLDPIRLRLEKMLDRQGVVLKDWQGKIRLLPMAARRVQSDIFMLATQAVLKGHRIAFTYQGVHDQTPHEREASPQTLVRYRDNWFLDAFCHAQKGLRSFSLSRMRNLRILAEPCLEIPRTDLDAHFADAYGIFGGKARRKAILVFEGLAAKLVANEQWHPRQKVSSLPGGKVRLEFPCGDLRELVRDVMRYADEVAVEGPEELKTLVRKMIEKAVRNR